MKYAIVYSSRTGNTKLLAQAIRDTLPPEDCLFFGTPSPEALAAPRIYAGFWTDKGSCDPQTAAFLETLTDQELYLFGTAGFGGSPEYFAQILSRTGHHLRPSVRLTGSFMCQGKMPPAVRERYEKMQKSPVKIPNVAGLIENFDRALSHPDSRDLEALRQDVRAHR